MIPLSSRLRLVACEFWGTAMRPAMWANGIKGRGRQFPMTASRPTPARLELHPGVGVIGCAFGNS